MALTIGILSGFAIACSAYVIPAGHQYVAPGPGDVRSPCPGLNTLANHNFLPHNGKGITVQDCITGLGQGLNVAADFASIVGALALQSNPTGVGTSFDLDMLDEHNFPIEHDCSLSREDYYFGNDHSFNQTIWNEVLAYFQGLTTITYGPASLARYHRVQNSAATNPTDIYGPRQFVFSYGETALYLSTMGNPLTGDAPLAYVQSLFEKERLPYELGWTPPTVSTSFPTLGAMITQLYAANPMALPEGLTLGEGALRDVWELRNPITGKLLNATEVKDNPGLKQRWHS